MSREHRDVYRDVTDQILGYLERGVRPWAAQWQAPCQMPLRVTGEPYRGVNVVLLWMAATRAGFSSPTWMTFQQAKTLGASVRKGEKAARVVFFEMLVKADRREGHEGEETTIPLVKTYAVFNADQIDGLPERFAERAPFAARADSVPGASFFDAIGADVRHGGAQPCYVPSLDQILIPAPSAFKTADAYAATLAHELVHWTGHETRLARNMGHADSSERAVEELIAELGAAFVCARLGIAAGEREDHAAYIAGYLSVLKHDPRAFLRAASAAQKAADFLHEAATNTAQASAA